MGEGHLDKTGTKMIPPEQVGQIKEQLIRQIESTFPEDKQEIAIKQIEAMNDEQLEEFLIQNQLIKNADQADLLKPSEQKCIFCSIVFGGRKPTK